MVINNLTVCEVHKKVVFFIIIFSKLTQIVMVPHLGQYRGIKSIPINRAAHP